MKCVYRKKGEATRKYNRCDWVSFRDDNCKYDDKHKMIPILTLKTISQIDLYR